MTALPSQSPKTTPDKTAANRLIAVGCVAFFGTMVGAAYASVPLYQLFCQITGYGGTPQRVEQVSEVILDQTITVRFDANVSGGLPWTFKPVQRSVTMPIGETVQVSYKATNEFSTPTRGKASLNVTTELADSYFSKIDCFCFTDTELKPGETIDMPVVFYIDPEIVKLPEFKNLPTITLSYTFFPTEGEPAAQAAAPSNKLGG